MTELVGRPIVEIRAAGAPILTERLDIAHARIAFEGGCVANLTASRVSFERLRKLRVFAPSLYCSVDMKEQLDALGCLYDWSKELASCDPAYYRWNQWLFLRMWERGLAYRKTAPVNWCPGCRTVLANEQVVDGRCERSDDVVEIRDLTQWFFRVTDYADRLLEGLDRLPHWSERVKTMQRNWIGRSDGAEILFRIDGLTEPVKVFTTRPDTLYGATFLALAPEHPVVARLAERSPQRQQIEDFVERVRRESRLEREAEGGAKEGLDTGVRAVNPATGEPIPVWLANFVLPDYGTGAIMRTWTVGYFLSHSAFAASAERASSRRSDWS